MFAAGASGKPAAAGAVTDPNFNSTTLLLETTGTNGQQNNTFLDSSTNNFTITRTGTPTQGTFTPFSQTGWSGWFSGAGNKLTVPAGATFAYGTNPFTLEAWINPYTYQLGTYMGGVIFCQTAFGQNYFMFHIGNGTAGLTFGTGGGTAISSAAGTVPLNAWTHVAIVREGTGTNQTKIYINGTLSTTSTCAYNFTNTTYAPTIANYTHSLNDLPYGGYISNFRIVKGTALYTANFTPSTTPLTAVSGTSLLTLQSNYFKDNSSNNFAITATGTPSIQAFSPFAPAAAYSTATVGGSGYFNGTTDYLQSPANAVFAPGTGDYTVEGWLYATTTMPGNGGTLYAQTVSGTNYFQIVAGNNANPVTSNLIGLWSTNSGGGTGIYSSTAFVLNTWNHFAIVRVSGIVTVYLNGIGGTPTSNTTNLTNTTYLPTIARYTHSSSNYFPGYISNFRYVNGTALYTANFTPPTAPLTAVSGTSLLLNETNAGIYDATAKNDVTTVGTAQASTTQSKFGGTSMYFNGTTDCIKFPFGSLAVKSSDFTIEAWIYPTVSTINCFFMGQGDLATIPGGSMTLYLGSTAATCQIYIGSTAYNTSTPNPTLNTWSHVAFVRYGATWKSYLNGIQVGTGATTVSGSVNAGTATYPPVIGISLAAGAAFNGYMDDFRFSLVARYTANFTPPTAPFPVS